MNTRKISQATRRPRVLATSILSLLALGAFVGGEARAAAILWTGATNTFSAAGNWSGTNTPPSSGDSLVFGAAGAGGLLLNNDLTSGLFNVAGITFNLGAGAFVIGNGTTTANAGNTFALTGDVINNSTNLQTINNPFSLAAVRTFTTTAGGGNITLGGNLSGAGGGITKLGVGTLTLSGTNTYTGATKVGVGTLALANGASISGTSSLIVGDTGTSGLGLTGGSFITTTGIARLGVGGFSGTMLVDGAGSALTVGDYLEVGYGDNGVINITGGGHVSAATTVALGVLSGSSGTVTVSGSDSLLSSTSTLFLGYFGTGILTVDSGGIVNAGGQLLLGSQSGGTGVLNLNANGTLQVGGTDGLKKGAGNAGVNVNGGHLVVTGSDLTTSVPMTFTNTANFHTGSFNATFSGVLGGTGGFRKYDAGKVTFTENNSYAGGTTIDAGTLQLGNGGAAGSIAGNVTNNGTLIFKHSDDYTFPGVISGTGRLVNDGNNLRFNAAQTYTGPTQVNSGVFVLPTTVDLGLSASTVVTVASGAIVDLSNRAQTFAGLTGGGTVYSFGGSAGSLTLAVASGQTYAFSGSLGGSFPNFPLTKSGAGTQVLSSAATYTGATTISAGTLQLGAGGTTGSLSPGSAITNNATLAFNRTNTITQGTDFANVISGSGQVIQQGSGTLILNGANTYTGATTISAGTLQLGDGGTTGSLAPGSAITNNGTLVFDRSNITTQGTDFASMIGGSGQVIQQGTGTLVLNSANSYTGATTISAGTLQLGDGGTTGSLSPGSAITNNATLVLDRSNTTTQGIDFASVIGGSGQVIQQGTGTLVLNSANSYTGATTISGTTLVLSFGTVSSNILSSASTLVLGGGTLQLSGSGTQTVNGLTTIAGTGNRIVLGANETLTLGALISAGSSSWLNFDVAAGGANGATAGSGIVKLAGQIPGDVIHANFTVADAGGFGLATVNGSDQIVRSTTANLLPTSGAVTATSYMVNNNAGGPTAAGSSTLTLTASQSVQGITVDTTPTNGVLTLGSGVVLGNNTWNFGGIGSHAYTVTGGAGLSSVAADDGIVFNIYNGSTVNVASPILANGVNTLTSNSIGALILTGVNTFTGGTTLNGGTLQLGNGTAPAALVSGQPAEVLTGNGLNAVPAVVANNAAAVHVLNTATITGGKGGDSLDTSIHVKAGNGGSGIIFSDGGSLTNDGSIAGGIGGTFRIVAIYVGYEGGDGGDGVSFTHGGTLTNSGTIAGATGGLAGSYGGKSGNGVSFRNGGSATNSGTITGALGRISYSGENGGAGLIFTGGGSLTNTGVIAGGDGASQGGLNGSAGSGGAGVFFTNGGSLTNSGTISGGLRGINVGPFNSTATDGPGMAVTGAAGMLTNQDGGIINGGVSMDNFANSATLETGSRINGALDIGPHTGSTLTLTGSGSQTYSAAVTDATTFAGSLTKSGPGIWTLDQAFAYAGPTAVTGGTLVVDGSIAASSGVSISSGGKLSGHGSVSQISGAGLVAPGNLQILTGTKVDPSGGLDFAFSLTQPGAPTYANASASGNDVLHLTDATPFVLSLTAANTITVDFSGATLVQGDTYLGGFFADAAVAGSLLSNATFVFTGLGGGAAQYDGLVTQAAAAFATGTVNNGKVMEFKIVTIPEPGSASLAFLGGLGLLLGMRRNAAL